MRGIIDDVIGLFFPSARISALRSVAKKYGWGFTARIYVKSDPIGRYSFQLLEGNKDKRLVGVISTNHQSVGQYRIYDYNYFGGLGRRTSTVFEYSKGWNNQGRSPASKRDTLDLPAFLIQPRGNMSGFKKIFVQKNEPLIPTTPEFRENYTIDTAVPMDLRLALPPAFLDELGEHPGWTFEGKGEVLIAYQLGEKMTPEQIEQNFAFFEKLCRYLIH